MEWFVGPAAGLGPPSKPTHRAVSSASRRGLEPRAVTPFRPELETPSGGLEEGRSSRKFSMCRSPGTAATATQEPHFKGG
ncbi:hypothetical protein AGIG_G24986 [Arapaima gigas]